MNVPGWYIALCGAVAVFGMFVYGRIMWRLTSETRAYRARVRAALERLDRRAGRGAA